MSERTFDHLSLGGNEKVQKILVQHGSPGETVVFSDFVVKINRKGKEQTRVLLITNQALYNLKPNKPKAFTFKRKIGLDKICAVTTNDGSDKFILQVPEEYDYLLKSVKKSEIINVIQTRRKNILPDQKLNVINTSENVNDLVVTRLMAHQLTRQQILEKVKALAAMEVESDQEDRDTVAQSQAGNGIEKYSDDASLSDPNICIQDFELLKVLGRGAFGKVMQVKKKDDGKIYAMKILKKQAIIARNQVIHTKAERKILQAMQHPFLMTLRYAFQSKEKLYLVLDYYQGGELFFHLQKHRRFSEEVARLYVAEIAMAFGHLHANGVIYRDLKPENILLDDNGHVCLTDFGLAKELDAGERTKTFCGTPEYLAPEIIASEEGHDKMVDWWSLGILLYELTVGIPPFYSQSVKEMYSKIQHGVLRFPPFLTDPCKNLIVLLLNRNPAERLGNFDEIKEHPFFEGLDWDKVYKKEVSAPFKPTVTDGELDTSNFDTDFLNEPVVDSVVASSGMGKDAGLDDFKGFTYKGESALG
jgi:serine/threonine protein kinase